MILTEREPATIVGRYVLHGELASGGMATIHIGRLMGPVGFSRTVAVKRLHATFAKDPEFVAMFLDEARLAARIRHPNVVSILDVVASGGELLLVMDYIAGESLARLVRAQRDSGQRIPLEVCVRIMSDVLVGLHAAHEVKSNQGVLLGVVHRDVSPQNVLVGEDGISHLIDFGVAKAAGRIQTTREGQIKGKVPYMAPEQITAGQVDRRTDTYAAGAVLWEALVGRRLFDGENARVMYRVLMDEVPKPSAVFNDIPPEIDAIVMKAIARDPSQRYATALEMADALEDACRPATSRDVARWVQTVAADTLQERAKLVAEVESISRASKPPSDRPEPNAGEGASSSPPTVVQQGLTTGPGEPPKTPSSPSLASGLSASSSVDQRTIRKATSFRRWTVVGGAVFAVIVVAAAVLGRTGGSGPEEGAASQPVAAPASSASTGSGAAQTPAPDQEDEEPVAVASSAASAVASTSGSAPAARVEDTSPPPTPAGSPPRSAPTKSRLDQWRNDREKRWGF